ncbi:unnamed protein product [Caenorhabditis auriculariae]|uniref:Uncharacterized protein n=1 Tax=Caenorhabditis auriculariae TaxID=2777116 RepID=A0A8S1GWU0_9PELO|nr:unnamed protein product [Caenorhabditis auriculariae]
MTSGVSGIVTAVGARLQAYIWGYYVVRKTNKRRLLAAYDLVSRGKLTSVSSGLHWRYRFFRPCQGDSNLLRVMEFQLFQMDDHPDVQEVFIDLAKQNHESVFRNELIALCVLVVLLIIGSVIYFAFRSMIYMKKDKGETAPINTFVPLHAS